MFCELTNILQLNKRRSRPTPLLGFRGANNVSNLRDINEKIKHNKALADDEYNELMRQQEIKERPERAKQRQRNYEDGQLMKYGFYFGLFVGALLMFWLLQFLKWAGIEL